MRSERLHNFLRGLLEATMIQLKLLDHAGKAVTPQELETVADLVEAADKARALVRECERLAEAKAPRKAGSGVPYLS